jgi:Tol biopolymer transport system component
MIKTLISLALTGLTSLPIAAADDEKTNSRSHDAAREMVKDFDFTFNTDGSLMAYYSYRGEALPDIFLRDHHHGEKNLTERATTWDIEPDFSPDGKYIIYSSGPDMANMSLRIMKADGSHDREFFDGPDNEVGATWSPDGKSVLFASFNNNTDSINIFVSDNHGSHVRNLTENLSGKASGPSWSKDGNWVYFTHRESANEPQDIYKIKADGSHMKQLTFDGHFKMGPIESPDGNLILFISGAEGEHSDVFAIPSAGLKKGMQAHRLTKTNEKHEYFLRFSPDGSHLVFSSGDWDTGFAMAHIPAPKAHH